MSFAEIVSLASLLVAIAAAIVAAYFTGRIDERSRR